MTELIRYAGLTLVFAAIVASVILSLIAYGIPYLLIKIISPIVTLWEKMETYKGC